MSQHNHQPSLRNRVARGLLCIVFIHAVVGKLTGFAGVTGAFATAIGSSQRPKRLMKWS